MNILLIMIFGLTHTT